MQKKHFKILTPIHDLKKILKNSNKSKLQLDKEHVQKSYSSYHSKQWNTGLFSPKISNNPIQLHTGSPK